MAKKKISRKQLLKKNDEFLTLSARAVLFFTSHTRQFKFLGAGLGIILIAYLVGYAYLGSVNKKGQAAYNLAYDVLDENTKPDVDPKDLAKSENLFMTVIDEYGLSKVARLALPQIAHVKYLDRDYDQAIIFYQKFLDKISGHSQYESLTKLAMAACYEGNAKLKKAIEMLGSVVASPYDSFKDTAMLSLERVYRLDHQDEKAREVLEEFVQKYKTSPLYSMAKARLS